MNRPPRMWPILCSLAAVILGNAALIIVAVSQFPWPQPAPFIPLLAMSLGYPVVGLFGRLIEYRYELANYMGIRPKGSSFFTWGSILLGRLE